MYVIQLVVSARRTLIISFSLSASANIYFGSASSAEEDPNAGEAQETIKLLVLISRRRTSITVPFTPSTTIPVGLFDLSYRFSGSFALSTHALQRTHIRCLYQGNPYQPTCTGVRFVIPNQA